MHIRLMVSALCAIAAVGLSSARPVAELIPPATTGRIEAPSPWSAQAVRRFERIGENVADVDVRPGTTARVAFVLPIDVQ